MKHFSVFLFLGLVFLNVLFLFPEKIDAAATLNKTLTLPGNNLGLVGWWTFDGKDTVWTSGSAATTLDKSGSNNTGILTNMTQSIATVAGKIGQALSFDGIDDEVQISGLSLTGAHTVSMWVYPTTDPSVCAISICALFVERQIAGLVWAGSNQTVYIGSIADPDATSGSLALNTLYHIVATVDSGGNSILYINGANVDTGTTFPSYDPDVIGGDSVNSQVFPGGVDDVRVYNRELSAGEVTKLYESNQAKYNMSLVGGATLSSGLVGWWTFDGKDTVWASANTGTTLDKSGNNNTGILSNMTQSIATAAGKIGQALSFDGVNDEVTITDSTSLSITGDITIAGWIKKRASGSDIALISKDNGTAGNENADTWDYVFGVFAGSGNAMNIVSSVEGFFPLIPANTAITDTNWHHIAVTRSGSAITYYLDGASDGTQTSGTAFTDSNYNITIGADHFSGDNFSDGLIDDVRIYNRALTATEVSRIYNLGAR